MIIVVLCMVLQLVFAVHTKVTHVVVNLSLKSLHLLLLTVCNINF